MEQIEKNNKISVITVVYNDVDHIRTTIESFFSQTWENKEYIVIDGGSTDGTAEIIREYSDRLDYWCSEKDGGIYEAMNKGIAQTSGDWINILNSGDLYANNDSLKLAITKTKDIDNVDVIYGDSIEINKEYDRHIIAPEDVSLLEYSPIFRHGSSLTRTAIQKRFLFDLSKKNQLQYSLDWEMIYRVYKAKYRFAKSPCTIESFLKEGISNHPFLNVWLNYKITAHDKFNIKKFIYFIKNICYIGIKESSIYAYIRAFIIECLPNDITPHIPSWMIRKSILKSTGLKIGKGSFIMKKNYFINPNLVTLGEYCHINRNCTIDARGKIIIGNNVSISHCVKLITGSHDLNSPYFKGVFYPITINDYAWLCAGCTVLQGVSIGKGAVVCAGAIVTKDVEDYAIVAGIPAKKIGERNSKLNYHCNGYTPFA